MPRTKVDIPLSVEYLSILDQNGSLDEELEPQIEDEALLKLHRLMLLGRRFDEQLLSLQRQGRIGTFAPIKGQEAAQLGAASVMKPTDWFVPCFRETAVWLLRGAPMENILLGFGGYEEGSKMDEDSRNVPIAVPVGSQMLHAVGLAYGIKYRGENDLAMTFFGDGATSEGDFHEAMNFAGVYQLPVVFVCQNNHWAISVPRKRQTHAKTLAQKGLAYGFTGIQVDGNDVLAVYAAAKEAEEKARNGGGPTLIECITYRMSVHTTADDPKRYRTDDEVSEWEKRDPIERFQKYLIRKELLSEEKIQSLEAEIKSDIQAAVKNAEKLMKEYTDPLHMFEHTWAEMPPYLKEQREEMAEELKADAREGENG